MRRDDGTLCAACGAVWHRRARYCGVCGAALVVEAPHPLTVVGGRPRRRLLLGGGLAVLAVLVGVAAWLPGPAPTGPTRDTEVALPGADELPGPPTTDTEVDPSEDASVDEPAPAPVCEPLGCEVWRRSLGQPISGMSLGPDRLFYLQASTVIALDRATGVIRWRRPLDEAVRQDDLAPRGAGWSSEMVAGDDARVVVATSQGVQLTLHDGRPGWSVPLPVDGLVIQLQLSDDVVLVVHEVHGDADEPSDGVAREDPAVVGDGADVWFRAVGLSATDGTLRWERELQGEVLPQTSVTGVDDLLVTRVDDELVALELATGRARFSAAWTDEHTWTWLLPGFLLVAGGQEQPLQVLATRDGSLLAELDGWPQHAAVIDGRLLTILGRDDPAGPRPRYEAVAVTSDGGVAWTRPLAAADPCCACCPSLLDLGAGRVRFAADPRAGAQVVAAATGEVLWHDPLAPDLAEAAQADLLQVGDGLLVSSPHSGDGGYTLIDASGHHVRVRGGFWPLPEQADLDRSDGLALLASDSELVAVRFP
jgi:outer membrane protein assembly factor BamB